MRTVEFEGRWQVYDSDGDVQVQVQVQVPFDTQADASACIAARRAPDERPIRG